MRESLTIFAVAIILVLSALLVGPYFVNWNSQRDWLAARLSEAAGAKVRIDGPVDVKLLPRPLFRAARVSMEGASPQDPHLTAARLDAELSINGLLQGAVQFVDATVTAPRLDLTLRADGSVVVPAWDVQNPQKFQFSHLIVSDGTIAIRDEHGANRLLVSGIAAQGEADTLFGPLKLSGTADGPQGSVSFRLNTSAFAARQIRARLLLDGAGQFSHAEVDGVVAVAAPTAAASHAALGFDGTLSLAGSLHVADGAAPVPWTLAATGVKADARTLGATALELRAGVDGRALVANGTAVLAFGSRPSGVLQLRARQLDLDHIAVAPDAAPDTPRPNARQWLAALEALAGGGSPVPLSLSVSTGIDAVTLGNLTFTDTAASLDLTPGAAPRGTFAIAGPNGTKLTLDGVVEPGSVAAFKGQAGAETRDLTAAARWLDPFWPGTADWIANHAPFDSVSFTGQVEASRVGISARDMALAIDGSAFKGTASLTDGVGGERPRLFADVTADTLDLERFPGLGGVAAAFGPLDISVAAAADAVKLRRTDGGTIQAGRLAFHVTKRAGVVDLDQFSIAGLEGTTVTATAALDATRHLQAEGHAEAQSVEALAALLRQVAPGPVTEAVASRAAALSPLAFGFKLGGVFDDDMAFSPTFATGSGTLGPTRFAASVDPEPGPGGKAGRIDATATLDSAETTALLRQLGLPLAAVPLGASHVDLMAKGSLGGGFDTTATATLPDGKIGFTGFLTAGAGHGHVAAGGRDAAPLAKIVGWTGGGLAGTAWSLDGDAAWANGTLKLGTLSGRFAGRTLSGALAYVYGPVSPDALSSPLLTGSLTLDAASVADLTGLVLGPAVAAPSDGWSTAKFAAAPAWPRSEVALKIGVLGLMSGIAARDVGATATLAPGSLMLGNLSGHVLGGVAGGTLTVRRDGASASLSGQLQFHDLALTLPSLSGRMSGALGLAGTGPSRDGLVASLAGEGTLTIAGATIAHVEPGALLHVAAAFDKEGATVDGSTVEDDLAKALDRGTLVLGDVSTPVTIAAGTLRVVGLAVKRPDFTAVGEGSLNLRGQTLVQKITLASVDLPKDWKGDPPQVTVTWTGPLLAPTRSLDAAAFNNGLAARAIARDQERIELMQDDLRERAFFARRLRQIEAEQQAARDAAQIQKMVPLPPAAGNIRLRAPDAAAPPLAPGSRTPSIPAASPPGDLTKFLETLRDVPLPPAKPPVHPAPARPIDIGPSAPGGKPASSATPSSDPANAGRY